MTDWQTLDYRPSRPANPHRAIGMIGCGGIARVAARAYQAAGFNVVGVCDLNRDAAQRMRDEFFPDAAVFDDHHALLAVPRLEVVDIATHTAVRPPLVRDALLAGKHVQSQKPFVEDLAVGDELVALADERGVRLAVNQNGRWSPHFGYLLAASRAGLLGEVFAADFAVTWDHDRPMVGTPFALMDDVILLDFGIHWFDVVSTLFEGRQARSVYGLATRTTSQETGVPTLASAVIDFGDAQATLLFRASTRVGEEGRYRVDGSRASLRSAGPSLGGPDLVVSTEEGDLAVQLEGAWMPDGLAGTMGELLTALDEDREPTTSARVVLQGLRLCFAAVQSALRGAPVDPATITRRPA